MMHAEAASLLGAVALRAASATEQRCVRDHAKSCAVCANELAAFDAVAALLDAPGSGLEATGNGDRLAES